MTDPVIGRVQIDLGKTKFHPEKPADTKDKAAALVLTKSAYGPWK